MRIVCIDKSCRDVACFAVPLETTDIVIRDEDNKTVFWFVVKRD